jgi:hypothetical protein
MNIEDYELVVVRKEAYEPLREGDKVVISGAKHGEKAVVIERMAGGIEADVLVEKVAAPLDGQENIGQVKMEDIELSDLDLE